MNNRFIEEPDEIEIMMSVFTDPDEEETPTDDDANPPDPSQPRPSQ